jgi:hypothetical protein
MAVRQIPKPGQFPSSIRNLCEGSPTYRLAKLYNILPSALRRMPTTVLLTLNDPMSSFKKALDCYLATVPDEPTDYRRFRAANTNSLLDQCQYSTLKSL